MSISLRDAAAFFSQITKVLRRLYDAREGSRQDIHSTQASVVDIEVMV